jgi:hypothetical protein
MKTVLFVTFYSPPSDAIAARRTGGLAKYLPLYGWRVVMLTPRQTGRISDNFEVLATDYVDRVQRWRRKLHLNDGESLSMPQKAGYRASPSMVQRLRKWVVETAKDWLTYPDATWGWYRPAVEAGKRFLTDENADVILSSYGPATSHIVASTLAKDFKIPWVADYRDPWSWNFYVTHNWLLRTADKALEARTTSIANVFIGVTRTLASGLARRHPSVPTVLAYNGYDPEEMVADVAKLDARFSIVHCGYLYGGGEGSNHPLRGGGPTHG